LRTGSCRDDHEEGGELGQPCSPAGSDGGANAEPQCRGLCANVGAEVGVCSHRCKLGGLSNCGADGEAGVCRFPPAGHSFGDVGFCARLCDVSSECFPPAVICEPFSANDLREMTGYVGVCVPAGAPLK
jgi:hypothetical protein